MSPPAATKRLGGLVVVVVGAVVVVRASVVVGAAVVVGKVAGADDAATAGPCSPSRVAGPVAAVSVAAVSVAAVSVAAVSVVDGLDSAADASVRTSYRYRTTRAAAMIHSRAAAMAHPRLPERLRRGASK